MLNTLSARNPWWLLATGSALAALVLMVGCGDDRGSGGSFAETSEGAISINPPALAFPSTPLGDTVTQRLTITNVGQGTLVVNAIDLETRSSEFGLGGVGGGGQSGPMRTPGGSHSGPSPMKDWLERDSS